MRKLSIAFLVFIICMCAAFSFVACHNNSTDNQDDRMTAIYGTYVAYAKENNITPLSYEEWIESVKGQNGKDGVDGKDGLSVKSVIVNGNGKLIITFTDNSTMDAGLVRGSDGKDGVGIADIKIEDGILFIKYTNSDNYEELGKVQGSDGKDGLNGTNGKDGKGILKIEISETETNLIIYYTDGTKEILDLSEIVANPNDKLILVFSLLPDGTYGVMAGGMAKYNAVINIPSTFNGVEVTQILTEGFANLSSVQKIILPDSIKTIGNKSFQNCIGLKEVILPTKLERIEQYAFYGCAMLDSITIPNNVTFIGRKSFYSSGLTSAIFENYSCWRLVSEVKLNSGRLIALDGTYSYPGGDFSTTKYTYSYALNDSILAAKALVSKVSVKLEKYYGANSGIQSGTTEISYEDAIIYESDWCRE